MRQTKIGDTLRLLTIVDDDDESPPDELGRRNHFEHYPGDVGTVTDMHENNGNRYPIVLVPGRKSSSCYEPGVCWDNYVDAENITREVKINTLLGL